MIGILRAQGRVPATLLLAVYAAVLFVPTGALGDASDCDFNPSSATVEHARQVFWDGGYGCTEQELTALLANDSLSRSVIAEANALMAAVYYVTIKDEKQRRRRVREAFLMTYRAQRDWQGDLEVAAPEFRAIMNDARELVEWLNETSPELAPPQKIDTMAASAPAEAAKKKPWYRKWWAIGSGVGAVAVVVGLAVTGDNETPPEPPPVDTLPGFPDEP